MATAFKTLGFGNGFPFCLVRFNLDPNRTIQNEPSLEQTMESYWNLDEINWGGAVLNPTNEPKDLICNPNDNLGSDQYIITQTTSEDEFYVVSASRPRIVVDGSNEHYYHGLSASYFYRKDTLNTGESISQITSVSYSSTQGASNSIDDTGCQPVYYGSPPYIIGYSRTVDNYTFTNVTINGIPFVKTVRTLFDGFNYQTPTTPNPSCPNPAYLPALGTTPNITLHTY